MRLLLAWSARGPHALDVLSSIVLLEDFCFAVSYIGGCPERFFHDLDEAQPTMWLLKNVTIFRSFVSGVAYSIIVKPHFRRIAPFYLLVPIYENMLILPFLAF